jgi:hypothetical protein
MSAALLEVEPGVFRLPLSALLEYCDPMLDDPWGCGRIEEDDVLRAAALLTDCRGQTGEYDQEGSKSYTANVERIAHFYRYGWEVAGSDLNPITVDIGLAGYTPAYLIVDGNHRVAAAKLRRDEWLDVELIGELPKAAAIFLFGIHPDDYDGGLELLSPAVGLAYSF